ncbi:MAG: tape measure protein [Mesorhizobium sp.]
MATDLEQLVLSISADTRQIQRALKRLEGDVGGSTRNIERQFDKLNTRVNASFSKIGAGLRRELMSSVGGLGAILSTREIAQYADAWTEAGNKVRAAAQIAGVATRSLNGIKDLANETRSGFSETADLYAKLIRSASGVAKSENEIAAAVKVVNEAFKAGGASASEQVNGILQLSQALGSGLLQGDELRSIRENAPVLAQAIAKEFKTTIAGLKDLGAEGKITSDRIFKAILAAQKDVGAAFAQTIPTIKDAITQVNNEFTAYIGNANTSAGASQKLVEALQFLASHFKEIGDVVVQFATLLIGALTGRALAGMVAGLGNAVIALGSFLTALRTGTVVAGSFTAALGPIGLLAGAAAAAIYLLYDAQSLSERSTDNFNSAIGENEKALKLATDQTYAQVDALRQLIATQAQAARAMATQANADFEVALGRRDAFRKMSGGYDFAPFTYAVDAADKRAAALGGAAGQLEQQLADADKLLSSKPSGFGSSSGTVPGDGKKGSHRKTADDRFAESLQSIRDRTAALKAEQETLGATFFEQQKRSVALDLEQEALRQVREEARRKGDQDWQNAQLSPQQVQQIDEVSAAYARQADELRNAQEAMDLQRDVLKGVFSDMRSAMEDGKLDWQDLGNIALNVLDKIADKIENDLVDAILSANNAGGGGGGIFGSLISGIGGLFGMQKFPGGMGFASPNGFASMLGFDSGTANTGGRRGEPRGIVHGQEAVIPLPNGGKVPVQISGPMMPEMPRLTAKGIAAPSVQQVTIRVDVTGARGNQEIETMVQKGVSAGIDEFSRKRLPGRMQQIQMDPRAVG